MKGDVFIAFNQMVEEKMGIACWEALLNDVQPSSGGIYTSLSRYDSEELMALVSRLSEMKSIPQSILVEEFGFYLFSILNHKYPLFTQQQADLFSFLSSIDGVIHREVKKLFPDAQLPNIQCTTSNEKTMLLSYSSSKKLCMLAEGLIRGAARHYQVEYSFVHKQCMHDGYENCLFELTLKK